MRIRQIRIWGKMNGISWHETGKADFRDWS